MGLQGPNGRLSDVYSCSSPTFDYLYFVKLPVRLLCGTYSANESANSAFRIDSAALPVSTSSLVFLRATKTHSKAGQHACSVRLVQSQRFGFSVRELQHRPYRRHMRTGKPGTSQMVVPSWAQAEDGRPDSK